MRLPRALLTLVVIGVATLVAYAAPADDPQLKACSSNIADIGSALEEWATDHAGRFPSFPAAFQGAESFTDGRALVSVNGKWGVISTAGRWLLRPRYDAVSISVNGSYLVGTRKRGLK